MHLPQELLDEIINNLPLNEEESLRNCSLVARSWKNPSQRRLFERVEIVEGDLVLWQINISPANGELLQHVRSLSYFNDIRSMIYHAHTLRDYLASFRQLRHLHLTWIDLTDLAKEVEVFSAFRHTLSHLSTTCCIQTVSAFVILINYFSNLDHLDIGCLFPSVDSKPVPPLSRSTIREFHIGGFFERMGLAVFFERLAEHGLAFDKVVIGHSFLYPPTLSRVFNALGANAKRLSILGGLGGDFEAMSLSHFRELRELEISIWYSGGQAVPVAVLSSITSTNIRKITLVCLPGPGVELGRVGLQGYDDALCLLADRLKCKNELEVELRFVGDTNVTDFIAKFKEKGRVKTVWVDSDIRKVPCTP